MKRFILPLFALLVLIQWSVPFKIIWRKERVILAGREYKFETQPIDPSSPFMGRYISLDFKLDTFTSTSSLQFKNDEEVYVQLGENSKGFAFIKSVSKTPPSNNADYVEAVLTYITETTGSSGKLFRFKYPFDGFYMNEYKAPRAEALYRSSVRDSSMHTYALIKVLNGDATVTDVVIGNKSIAEWLK
jgi:uncharacterized membrane-anchored protein